MSVQVIIIPTVLVSETIKTSDQTLSNTTLTNITGLSFSVVTGVYYAYEFYLLFQSDTSTVGIKVSVTVPTFTRFGASAEIPAVVDGTTAFFDGEITSSGDPVTGTAVAQAAFDYVCHIKGVLLPSASGTLQVQAALETGTTNIITRQGSRGILYKKNP